MHKQPPSHHSGIPALVPGGAMCTTGMAMLGSAFLQPTGCMLHVSKCSIVINFIFALSPAEHAHTTFVPPARACSPSVPCLSANFLFRTNSIHVPLITYGQHSI